MAVRLDGANCLALNATIGATYRVRDKDVGLRLRVRVTATNADGSDTAVSNPTGIVQGSVQAEQHHTAEHLRLAGPGPDTDAQTPACGPARADHVRRTSGGVCNTSGGNCQNDHGATGRSYT